MNQAGTLKNNTSDHLSVTDNLRIDGIQDVANPKTIIDELPAAGGKIQWAPLAIRAGIGRHRDTGNKNHQCRGQESRMTLQWRRFVAGLLFSCLVLSICHAVLTFRSPRSGIGCRAFHRVHPGIGPSWTETGHENPIVGTNRLESAPIARIRGFSGAVFFRRIDALVAWNRPLKADPPREERPYPDEIGPGHFRVEVPGSDSGASRVSYWEITRVPWFELAICWKKSIPSSSWTPTNTVSIGIRSQFADSMCSRCSAGFEMVPHAGSPSPTTMTRRFGFLLLRTSSSP